MEGQGSLPLPEDPALAAMAVALRDAGHWADVVDRDWRLVYSTDDMRRICRRPDGSRARRPRRALLRTRGRSSLRLQWRSGPNTVDQVRELFGAARRIDPRRNGGRPRRTARARPPGAPRHRRSALARRPVAGTFDLVARDARRRTGDLLDHDGAHPRPHGAAHRDRADHEARSRHGGARNDRGRSRSAALRAHAARREGGPAPGGDPVRGPRGVVPARPSPAYGQLLRARAPPRARRRSVRHRRGRPRRSARRRRRGRLLPRRDRRLGVRRGPRLHRRRARAQKRAHRRRDAEQPRCRATSSCASACTGDPPSTSGRSRPADAPRSPHSATRSTRRLASRPAQPAGARSPPRRS